MNVLRKWSTCVAIIILLFCVNALPTSAQDSPFHNIDQFMDELMLAHIEDSYIPNAAISIVSDGEIIYEKGFGKADLTDNLNVKPDKTLFRIGSISKLFTWTAVMQLVEQGQLDLHTDVNEYIDFKIPDQIENNKDGKDPEPITLHHLMTHTPGFEDYPDAIFRLSESDFLPLEDYVQEFLPKRAFPAGDVMAYSNYGTVLAGYIVEHVSGMNFTDYIDAHIFSPLSMTQSTFQQPIPKQLAPDMTEAYRYVSGTYEQADFVFMPAPAGGMSSTARDMAYFMMNYLNGGSFEDEQILQNKTVEQMFSQHFTHNPHLKGMGLGFIEGHFNDKRTLFHNGSTMLFDAGFYLVPEEDIGIFIAYSGADHLVHLDIFNDFMDAYFPVKQTSLPVQAEDAAERSHAYVGEYHQNRKSFTTDEKILSLTMGTSEVDVDDEDYLTVTHFGETHRFLEIEHGVYENVAQAHTNDPYGGFRTVAFEQDSTDNTLLMTDGPMTYSKAPWYSTVAFNFSALIISIFFILLTLIYSGLAYLIRKLSGKTIVREKLVITLKSLIIVYGLLTIGLIAGIAISGQVDPVYQLPLAAPEVEPIIDLIPFFMTVVGIAIICLTIICWFKRTGKLSQRIHFSLFSSVTILFIWMFAFWNLF